MNINFKINKKEENVIVSNEKGTMDIREYQDNIKEVLALEDVVEEQENDLYSKKRDRINYNQKIKDIDLKIEKEKSTWHSFKKYFLISMVGIPAFLFIIFIFCEWLIGSELAKISIQQLIAVLKLGATTDLIAAFLAAVLTRLEDFCLSHIKKLKKDKLYIEILNKNLEVEISLLEKILEKNKIELSHLLDQKYKTNIYNMSEEVQKVSYHDLLEIQRQHLIEMYEINKTSTQETTNDNQSLTQQKGSILGRFKKKKENL